MSVGVFAGGYALLASVALVLGLLLGAIVLVVTRRGTAVGGEPAQKPTVLGWWTLALGLAAATTFAVGIGLAAGRSLGLLLASIACAFAGTVIGIGSIMKRDRHWPTWVGLVGSLMPAVFWIAFAAGEILGPKH